MDFITLACGLAGWPGGRHLKTSLLQREWWGELGPQTWGLVSALPFFLTLDKSLNVSELWSLKLVLITATTECYHDEQTKHNPFTGTVPGVQQVSLKCSFSQCLLLTTHHVQGSVTPSPRDGPGGPAHPLLSPVCPIHLAAG